MQALMRLDVMGRAGVAALLTVIACIPRLVIWQDRSRSLPMLFLILLWAAFFLWSFVMAWHTSGSGRPVWTTRITRQLWRRVGIGGLIAAFLLAVIVDPAQRALNPADYPSNLTQWGAMLLFNLSLDPLFLCFAPLAVALRLTHHPWPAVAVVILFNLLVLALKVSSSPAMPPAWLLVVLVVGRIGIASFYMHLYWWGGLLPVLGFIFLLQLRLLLPLILH